MNDEQLFQETRARNIAIIQHITFMEYLPLLLGKFAIPVVVGAYNSTLNTDVSAMFCTVEFSLFGVVGVRTRVCATWGEQG